jgi:hypothetical protein
MQKAGVHRAKERTHHSDEMKSRASVLLKSSVSLPVSSSLFPSSVTQQRHPQHQHQYFSDHTITSALQGNNDSHSQIISHNKLTKSVKWQIATPRPAQSTDSTINNNNNNNNNNKSRERTLVWRKVGGDNGRSFFLPFVGLTLRQIPEPGFFDLAPEDILLVCTDGLRDSLPPLETLTDTKLNHFRQFDVWCHEVLNYSVQSHHSQNTPPDDVTVGAIFVRSSIKQLLVTFFVVDNGEKVL